jgi:dTDP-glucose 4,6-dehydratase
MLCLAAHATYGQDIVITRGTNNYGPRQHPEKLIPRMIWCALRGKRLPVYGDGRQVRDWIHVDDHCRGMIAAWLHGKPGEVYLLGANREIGNLDLVREILRLLGKPESLIEHVADRPGHDRRYAVDSGKARRELGWEPQVDFTAAFSQVVRELAEELAES